MSTTKPPPRCDLRGPTCFEGWRHNGSKRYRCPNRAEYVSSGGTKVCAACLKHRKEVAQAQINIARRELEACKTAKRIKR